MVSTPALVAKCFSLPSPLKGDPMPVMFVYVTAGSPDEARLIGRAVVEGRLAACANVIAPMTAIYRWEGRVQEALETVLILKTTDTRLAALIDRVRALHSYDCPCIEAIEVADGNPAFLAWVAAETEVP